MRRVESVLALERVDHVLYVWEGHPALGDVGAQDDLEFACG